MQGQAQQATRLLMIQAHHLAGHDVMIDRGGWGEPGQGLVQGLIETVTVGLVAGEDATLAVRQDPDRVPSPALRSPQQGVGQPDVIVAQGLHLHVSHGISQAEDVAVLVIAQVGQGLGADRQSHGQGGDQGRQAQAEGDAQAVTGEGQPHAFTSPRPCAAISAMPS